MTTRDEDGWERLPLEGAADVRLDAAFLAGAEASRFFEALRAEVPLEQKNIVLFGKPILQPRLVAWIGDPGAAYAYSGVRNEPHPWTPALLSLRDAVSARTGHPFNSVLVNLYRDGRDSMGFHADAEPELGPEPVIASVSLGATRRFELVPRRGSPRGRKVVVPLSHGSLLLMAGATQALYRHGVPKQPAVAAPRLNLTFRLIRGP